MQTRQVETRHGIFTIFDEDELVGLSLSVYGEYSEGEVDVFRKVLRPGDVAIDVGANIGAFTIPMAKLVGEAGHIHAFEASAANVSLLHLNVKNNQPANVWIHGMAASDNNGTLKVDKQSALHAYSRRDINEGEFEVACGTIDSLASAPGM